jgi:hypothetical protein
MVTMSSLVHRFLNVCKISDCRENLEVDECSECPRAVPTPDMIETVRELISSDRRMTLRMVEEEVLSRLV